MILHITAENIKVVNFTDATLSTAFTQTSDGIIIASGVVTKDLNFTKTTSGDILYVAVTRCNDRDVYRNYAKWYRNMDRNNTEWTETWTEIDTVR